MKISRVRLEVREIVLCASVKSAKVDFNSLDAASQIKELRTLTGRQALNVFRTLKNKDNSVVMAFLKKNPKIIEHIKLPTEAQLKCVLDTHPHALNKLPGAKRSEALVIQAIRPMKKHLFGPRDERAKHTLKNISALAPNTTFTPRVYHEVVRLMCGAPEKTIKKLIATFEKQKKKIPDELRNMVQRIKSKSLSSAGDDLGLSTVLTHKARKDMDNPDNPAEDTDSEFFELSLDRSKSIIRVTYKPYTITVNYPDSPEYNYEYYIGDVNLFNHALGLQYNAGAFSKFVREHKFSVKKIKMDSLYD